MSLVLVNQQQPFTTGEGIGRETLSVVSGLLKAENETGRLKKFVPSMEEFEAVDVLKVMIVITIPKHNSFQI